jgi:hypothetical protein
MSENVPTPLDFLRSIYSNEAVPLPVRMRAAIEAAPYVHPKLAVSINADAHFGKIIEERMRARGRTNVIGAPPPVIEPEPTPTEGA